jgi:hypothetical protein
MSPWQLRAALRRGGTAQQGGTFPVQQNIGPLPDVVRTAIELNLYQGQTYAGPELAHGFGAMLPGNGGNGIEGAPGQIDFVGPMARFDDDGPGPNAPRLYAAGWFDRLGEMPANSIASWNGVGWQQLGSGVRYTNGLNGDVNALAVFDADGPGVQRPSLYAAGFFTLAGSAMASNIARWDGTNWYAVGGGLTGGGVYALAVIDEDGPGFQLPSLVVAGEFSHAGGVPVSRIARWRGGQWSALGDGFDDRVAALCVYDADDTGPGLPRLVAGGHFERSGNGSTRMGHVAEWIGGLWQPVGGGTSWQYDRVWSLAAVPLAGMGQQYLFVGGDFWGVSTGPVVTHGLAVWTGTHWIMPSAPCSQPQAMVVHDDGTDPTLPRQPDVWLTGFTHFGKMDPLTFVYTPVLPALRLDGTNLFVHDEDGAGAVPPDLWFGGYLMPGAPAAGLGRLFGSVPRSVSGQVTTVVTGCGGPHQPTIGVVGRPTLGAPFSVQFECLPESLPLLVVGIPEPVPVPLCAGAQCAFGVQPLVYAYGRQEVTYQFPNDLAFMGIYFAFQGLELFALPYGQRCAPPTFPIDLRVSDTLVLTF